MCGADGEVIGGGAGAKVGERFECADKWVVDKDEQDRGKRTTLLHTAANWDIGGRAKRRGSRGFKKETANARDKPSGEPLRG